MITGGIDPNINSGFLEVGAENGDVVINHPRLTTDSEGRGFIVFSPSQARGLAAILVKQAAIAENEANRKAEAPYNRAITGNRSL